MSKGGYRAANLIPTIILKVLFLHTIILFHQNTCQEKILNLKKHKQSDSKLVLKGEIEADQVYNKAMSYRQGVKHLECLQWFD